MRGKRWLIGFGVFLVLLFVGKVLLLDIAASPSEKYVIDLEALHAAATGRGPLPSQIEVQRVADFAFLRSMVVAGDGLQLHPMVLVAHRVLWPDRSILIDTAMSPANGAGLPGSKFDAAAFAKVEKAMTKADTILLTHEHVDHVGGIASAPDFGAIASRVMMTREQFNGPKLERDQFAPGTLAQLKLLDYTGLYTVAPGIVLQKAPGHTPGSQLVYVELANGTRYLFVGDIAWSEDNIRQKRGRPGFATLLMKEDRSAVAAELDALAALPKDVHVVTSHDPVALERDLAAGLFKEGFGD